MRHRRNVPKLNKKVDHRRSMLRNLATSVIIHDKIQTTEAKAKAVRPMVEHLIMLTKAKNTMNAIRQAHRMLSHEQASKKLFEALKKRYEKRISGFTRITLIGFRQGDAAHIVQLELV